MEMGLTAKQFQELDWLARRSPDAHVRSRALAVRAVALGHTRQAVAEMLPYSPYSIGQWYRAFRERGGGAFTIAPGRGRRSLVDEHEVLSRLRRSPHHFGVDRSRWTLRALGQACPSLTGMSDRGIQGVINRLGFRYKRGQPWIHSPDPQYAEKKTPSKQRTPRHGRTRKR